MDLYNQGLSEIESQVEREAVDTELDRRLTGEKLDFLLRRVNQDVAEKEQARKVDLLRFVPDFLKNKRVEQQAKAKKSALGASFFGPSGVGLTSPRAITPLPKFND